MQHTTTLKRISQYLSETHKYKITYNSISDAVLTFEGYTNAAFVDKENFKFTTGYVFITISEVII
jgi:hypothetical protein